MRAEGPRARRRRAIAERFFPPSSLCYLRSRVLLAYPVYFIRSITLEFDLSRRETVILRSSLLRGALNRAERDPLFARIINLPRGIVESHHLDCAGRYE